MAVAPAVVEHEEHDAARVGQPARHQPPQPARGHQFDQGLGGDDDDPAHRQIQPGRKRWPVEPLAGLQPHAQQRQPPDQSEQGPAPGAAQRAQRERRIRARDQQIDGGVVEHVEDLLGAAGGQRVIDGGSQIQQAHRGREHRRARDEGGVALAHGGGDQKRRRGQRAGGAESMADAVGDFFAQCLGTVVREHGHLMSGWTGWEQGFHHRRFTAAAQARRPCWAQPCGAGLIWCKSAGDPA
ncbi:hypothetical protein D3C87_897190 [compost metagenome]